MDHEACFGKCHPACSREREMLREEAARLRSVLAEARERLGGAGNIDLMDALELFAFVDGALLVDETVAGEKE